MTGEKTLAMVFALQAPNQLSANSSKVLALVSLSVEQPRYVKEGIRESVESGDEGGSPLKKM